MFSFLKKSKSEAATPAAPLVEATQNVAETALAATTEAPVVQLSWRERLFKGLAKTRAK